jgi:NAD(P)-dependent dehydrogenase (short-subunit alcohol dehydrogenase family)
MTAGSIEKDQKSDLSGTGKGESNPAGRPGSEKDMAGCALFLASRAAIYMNGQVSRVVAVRASWSAGRLLKADMGITGVDRLSFRTEGRLCLETPACERMDRDRTLE